MVFLEVVELAKRFAGVVANSDISFRIEKGEIVGLIGPNGAGKTTLFNCIVGFHKPDQGIVRFKGKDITGFKPFQTNREGIGRTFQIVRISGDLTVVENVMVGAFCRTSDPPVHACISFRLCHRCTLSMQSQTMDWAWSLPRHGLSPYIPTPPIQP